MNPTIDFTFSCPRTGSVFHTDQFDIIDNQGVKTDPAGNRFLDAKVKLTDACPFCGERHVFQAGEIACPFTGPAAPEQGDEYGR